MSRLLPAHPNLDHLRKQAKDLLQDLQKSNPEAQLADAQQVIAREYGFASWPKLKAHVESLSPSPERHPFVGTWIVNLAKSKRHPLNQFQSARMEFALMGDSIVLTSVQVSESGQEENFRNAIHADGCEHPIGSAGHSLVATWVGTRVLGNNSGGCNRVRPL